MHETNLSAQVKSGILVIPLLVHCSDEIVRVHRVVVVVVVRVEGVSE
jgi:hypothetical protein